jgi:hypothetical protein
MKIVEGMKKLKLIEKKIDDNVRKIEQYASLVSTERTFFENEKEQKKEVESLLQSNEDLVTEYLRIKRQIEATNLAITAEFDGKFYTLSDLLVIQRRLGDKLVETQQALNSKYADQRIRQAPSEIDGKKAQVVRLYDENKKNEKLQNLMEFTSNISARLEVINATTDLVELK